MKESLILSLLLISVFSDDSYYPPNMPQDDSYYQCYVLTIEYPYIIEDNKNYEKSCFIMYKDIRYFKKYIIV